MFFRISDGVKCLCKNMVDNPNDWVQGDYHFINKKNPDIKIWTANGWDHIALNGNDAFNNAEKKMINSSIQKSISNRLININT